MNTLSSPSEARLPARAASFSTLSASQIMDECLPPIATYVSVGNDEAMTSLCRWLQQLGWFCGIDEAFTDPQQASPEQPEQITLYIIDRQTAIQWKRYDRLPAYWVLAGESNMDALYAFELNASAFLSLPLNDDTAYMSLRKVVTDIQREFHSERYSAVARQLCSQEGISAEALAASLRRRCAGQTASLPVSVRCASGWCCIAPEDIKWIEAAGDYMCIYTNQENHIVRITLTELCRKLPCAQFIRTNRSVVVNMARVASLDQFGPNIFYVTMDDGTSLKISRRYYTAYWQSRFSESISKQKAGV